MSSERETPCYTSDLLGNQVKFLTFLRVFLNLALRLRSVTKFFYAGSTQSPFSLIKSINESTAFSSATFFFTIVFSLYK